MFIPRETPARDRIVASMLASRLKLTTGGHVEVFTKAFALGWQPAIPLLSSLLVQTCEISYQDGGAEEEAIALSRLLTEHGASTGGVSSSSYPLAKAVRAGNHQLATELVRLGADVNHVEPSGDTVLVHACQHKGSEQVLRWIVELVALGADVNRGKKSALGSVAAKGFNACCRFLLEHGVDLESSAARDALRAAAQNGHESTCRLLLEAGVEPNGPHHRDTALHRAAERGHAAICSLLLEHGADPEAVNWEGETPATVALRKKHHAVYEVLNDV